MYAINIIISRSYFRADVSRMRVAVRNLERARDDTIQEVDNKSKHVINDMFTISFGYIGYKR